MWELVQDQYNGGPAPVPCDNCADIVPDQGSAAARGGSYAAYTSTIDVRDMSIGFNDPGDGVRCARLK